MCTSCATDELGSKLQDVSLNSLGNGSAAPGSTPAAAQKVAAANALAGNKKDKVPKKDKKKGGDASKYPLRIEPQPEFLTKRMEMFEKLKEQQAERLAKMPREPIKVTLPDGGVKDGISWETSPLTIANSISKSFADKQIVARITKSGAEEGELWDLDRPLEYSCSLELLDFESEAGKKVFWHSSAHIMGEACEQHFGCSLAVGPPIDEGGYYYEMAIADRTVSEEDYGPLDTLTKEITKQKQPFERVVMTKAELLDMFAYNKYKVELISKKMEDNTSTTIYRCGTMVDFCKGPHISNTGKVKSIAVMKNSASFFLGDQKLDSLQRIYGISFPDSKQMTEHKAFLAAAKERDHRKIGKEQELFFFHELSPGSCFFLPHGTRIYNTLLNFMKAQYHTRGYSEVVTPNMYNKRLWDTSGHNEKYADDMFNLEVDKERFALKPMNCPGHCLMFGHRERSYRELPIRMADFGVLHRNEASGALSGLTRVRRFQQDDAHIFCMPEQIESEIRGVFDFIEAVYKPLGFEYKLKLSTRPEKYLGEVEVWNNAEKVLASALDAFVPGQWSINEGDGAFYGPKIDITILDALKRSHQCATIQLDFQLPLRFDLTYRGADDAAGVISRPVMIHRAILGSLERFMGILTEHTAGRWPFWLSPRQVMVIPVAVGPHGDYAKKVQKQLWDAGLFADIDLSGETLPKKIRNGETGMYNFLFVVGSDEEEGQTVNVRARNDENIDPNNVGRAEARSQGVIKFETALGSLLRLRDSRAMGNNM